MMISVVIPAHNAACTLGECLQAIRRSQYVDYEVIVADDASSDSTGDVARNLGCHVIRAERNIGAAQAKNLGASEARGDVILFTDADILLQPDTLTLVAEDLNDAGVSAVVGLLGPRLRYRDFGSQFKNLWMYYTYSLLADSKAAHEGVGLFFTSIASIRKGVFEQVGGFDTNYRGASVTEDIEFGQRLLSAGYRVRLDGRLTVEHLKRYTPGAVLKTDLQRAFGLAKTWLRKKLEPELRTAGEKYYASVPWSFMLGVPLSWMLPCLLALALLGQPPSRQLFWFGMAAAAYVALLLANARFIAVLRRERGWVFGLQSCLFLPLDLWVSGLGALWAVTDYVRGNRY